MPEGWDAGPNEIRGRIDPGSPDGSPLQSLAETGPDNKDRAALQCRSSSLIGVKQTAAGSDYDWTISRICMG